MSGTSIFSSLLKFINYWYFRYIMMTELYILESWERCFVRKSNYREVLALSYVCNCALESINSVLIVLHDKITSGDFTKLSFYRPDFFLFWWITNFLSFLDLFLFAVFLMQWVFNYAVILPVTAKVLGFQLVPDKLN